MKKNKKYDNITQCDYKRSLKLVRSVKMKVYFHFASLPIIIIFMRILAIETSCDDTGIAILEYNKTNQPKILANFISSQIKIHAPWGGVVPMLAKREHQKNLVLLLKKALEKSGL